MKNKINCINKGKNFERSVVKILSKITNCIWERVPCSGAFATSRKTESFVFNGDVFCEQEPYRESIVIECKATKELILISDIFNPKSLLNKWITQCKRECGNSNWLLIFKMNGRKPIFLSQKEFIANPLIEKITERFGGVDYANYWIGEINE